MRSLVRTAALVLLLPAAAAAQNSLDGKWAGQVETEGGPQAVQAVITTDVEKVSGSIFGGGSEIGIKDGVLSGNTLTFTSEQRNDGVVLPLACTATVSVDTLTVSCTADGQSQATEFVLTRQQ
jgi:hypothetical protein